MGRTQGGEVGPLLLGLLCSEVQQLTLLPTPGSRVSLPVELCGMEKNGKELAHLHGGEEPRGMWVVESSWRDWL